MDLAGLWDRIASTALSLGCAMAGIAVIGGVVTNPMRVMLEIGPKGKKVVAVAPDWPGLERGAKTVLIYTAAADSEGTLGGLAHLGSSNILRRQIKEALESAHLCASDPLCGEMLPGQDGRTIHASACHACLFAPETLCERGNKYLDRSTLTSTIAQNDIYFFED